MRFQNNANGARAFMGNILCGVKRVKRFVKYICIASFATWKRISEISALPPPWRNFCRSPCSKP